MYLHAELVHTWSDQCFSVAVYLNIKMTKINSRYPVLLKRLREKVSYLWIKVQGCESAACNSNQQREMLRREMSKRSEDCTLKKLQFCIQFSLFLFLLLFASTLRRSSVPKFHKWSIMHEVGLWRFPLCK